MRGAFGLISGKRRSANTILVCDGKLVVVGGLVPDVGNNELGCSEC